MKLQVSGLHGGHSGIDIAQGRGNAIKIANRIVLALAARGARLSSINGGNKHNAIPRECEAVLFIPKSRLVKANKIAAQFGATVKAELATAEKDLSIALTEMPPAQNGQVLKRSLQKNSAGRSRPCPTASSR